MQASVKEAICQCHEALSGSPRSEWVQDWPCQALLTAAMVTATKDCAEAIKGGSSSLRNLQEQYVQYQKSLIELINGSASQLMRSTLSRDAVS